MLPQIAQRKRLLSGSRSGWTPTVVRELDRFKREVDFRARAALQGLNLICGPHRCVTQIDVARGIDRPASERECMFLNALPDSWFAALQEVSGRSAGLSGVLAGVLAGFQGRIDESSKLAGRALARLQTSGARLL
jgi:hypothetical protein